MTTPPALRQQALEAAHDTIRDGRWWLPPGGQVEVVDAVLEVVAARDGAPTQAAMAADAFEIPLHLINTTQPAEHCGNQLPPLLGDGPVTECVLRPGHQGSHANHDGARWIATPGADDDLEAARRRAVALQVRIDEARAWARQHLDPEQQAGLLAALRGDDEPGPALDASAGQSVLDQIRSSIAAREKKADDAHDDGNYRTANEHNAIAAGLRIAEAHILAAHEAPKETPDA